MPRPNRSSARAVSPPADSPPADMSSEPSDTSEEEDGLFSPSTSSGKGKRPATQRRSSKKTIDTPEPMTPNRKKSSEAEMNKMVHDCVYYMLVADQKKYAIKRTDILKHVLKEKDQKKQFNKVIVRAKDCLKKVFAITVIEISEKKGNYFLVNDDKDLTIGEFTEQQAAFRGLLLFILTSIFMKDGVILEDDLWKGLQVLDVDPEDGKPHPLFGDVKKYITQELVKQLYVVYQKVNDDPPSFEFRWGPRAEHEVDKEDMLRFVAEVYANEPRDWIVQHKQVEKEKGREKESRSHD